MHIKSGKNSFYVYIVTNESRKFLKTGITGDLAGCMARLRNKPADVVDGRDLSDFLIYLERFDDAIKAINRELEISRWSRKKKETLVSQQNPLWTSINEDAFINDWQDS